MAAYKKFLFLLILNLSLFIFLTIFIANLKLNEKFINKTYDKNYLVYSYQLQKINNIKNSGNLYFLGDSSLGNLIDANYFSKRIGIKTYNLALTEIYGYAGQLNMLKRILQKDLNPKKIFFINSIYFINLNVDEEAFYLTSQNFRDIIESSNQTEYIKHIYRYLLKYAKAEKDFNLNKYNNFVSSNIINDYIIQSKVRYIFKPKLINNYNSKVYYLSKISNLCDENNLECIFMNGPISNEYLKLHKEYATNTYKFLNKHLIKELYLDKKIIIENYDLGDTQIHINFNSKKKYTDKYITYLKEKNILQ